MTKTPAPALTPSSEARATHPDEPAGTLSLDAISAALSAGECPTDEDFDRFLPEALRAVSSEYWTPLRVASRVASWVARYRIASMLDIGSGAGKFCVAAALARGAGCQFIGLEQREHLIAAGRELARTFQVADRVTFIQGSLGSAKLPQVQAYYLFNPFGENLVGAQDKLDDHAELSEARYHSDIDLALQLLAGTRSATYVVTYNGFGASAPAHYECLQADEDLPYPLELWHRPAR